MSRVDIGLMGGHYWRLATGMANAGCPSSGTARNGTSCWFASPGTRRCQSSHGLVHSRFAVQRLVRSSTPPAERPSVSKPSTSPLPALRRRSLSESVFALRRPRSQALLPGTYSAFGVEELRERNVGRCMVPLTQGCSAPPVGPKAAPSELGGRLPQCRIADTSYVLTHFLVTSRLRP